MVGIPNRSLGGQQQHQHIFSVRDGVGVSEIPMVSFDGTSRYDDELLRLMRQNNHHCLSKQEPFKRSPFLASFSHNFALKR